MTNRNCKRAIALGLAAMLTLSGLVNAACSSSSTPTTPTTAEPGPAPVATDVLRIISVDADSIEVEGVDPMMGGAYRLRIEGIQSDRPIYYLNGVRSGDVFGTSAVTVATGLRNLQPEDLRLNSVATAVALAFSLWAAVEIVVYCGTPLYYATQGVGDLLDQAWGECVGAGIDALTAKVFRAADAATELGKALHKMGVNTFRTAIFRATGTALDWRIIKTALTRQRYHSAVAVIQVLTEEGLGKLYSAIREELGPFFVSEPPIPDPDPEPTPTPNPPPNPSPTPTPTPPPAPRVWTGAFTATGTFQLDASCVWRFAEEFSNVRLTLRGDGTGTLTATVRTTEGPKISGPASCPNNTFVRQQNDLYQLTSSAGTGVSNFELAPQAGSIRSLRGTASATGATGAYSLRSGAIGAGGVRQSNATFTLTPAR